MRDEPEIRRAVAASCQEDREVFLETHGGDCLRGVVLFVEQTDVVVAIGGDGRTRISIGRVKRAVLGELAPRMARARLRALRSGRWTGHALGARQRAVEERFS